MTSSVINQQHVIELEPSKSLSIAKHNLIMKKEQYDYSETWYMALNIYKLRTDQEN